MFRSLTLLFAAFLAINTTVWAEDGLPEPLRNVGIDQRLNEQAPLDLTFRDEAGKQVKLARYFDRKPVILSLVYYECPMLCTLVLNGMVRGFRAMNLNAGDQFEVVTVSFNPRETPELAAAKKKEYIKHYGRQGAEEGWHFLTGDEASIRKLAQAVGFRYAYDPKTGQYAHASGIMILTPEGRIAGYFYGVEYSARDLRLGLIEASAGKIGSPVDQVLLYCFHYDPTKGKYGLVIMNVMRLLGGATVLALGTFLFLMLRRDRRAKQKQHVDQISVIS
jgi:protein SCO1/2